MYNWTGRWANGCTVLSIQGVLPSWHNVTANLILSLLRATSNVKLVRNRDSEQEVPNG